MTFLFIKRVTCVVSCHVRVKGFDTIIKWVMFVLIQVVELGLKDLIRLLNGSCLY
jgi:hypothetical protein